MVRLGPVPAPQKLQISVYGPSGMLAPPRTLTPVSLPGTIVLDRIDPSLPELCVALEGLAGDGTVTSRGAVTVGIVPDMTANAAIELGATTMLGCTLGRDGGAQDLARDAGVTVVQDLAGRDLFGVVPVCPGNAIFCDDFESGDVSKWTTQELFFDLGAEINVQQAIVRHGQYALHTSATGHDMAGAGHSIVIKGLPNVTPPLAVRANVFAVQPLDHYGVSVELYDDTTHGFSVSADNQDVWTLTEDQATGGGPDHHTDMVPYDTGSWHCIEIVIDAAGFVTFYVDNHQLLAPFPRMSTVAYTTLQMGIGRTVNPVNDVYVDDVAVAPTRLYCP
jgi:hypothetical protein